jgi:cell division control protein 45
VKNRKGQLLPLLLAAHQPDQDAFMVVAVPATTTTNTTTVRQFGAEYRRAAEECRARIRHDGFDATVVQVASEDLRQFIHCLQRRRQYQH